MPPSGRSTRAGPAAISSLSSPHPPSSDAVIPDVPMAHPAAAPASARLSSTLRSTPSTLEITSLLVLSVKVSDPPAGAGAAALDSARLTRAMPREPVPSVHAARIRGWKDDATGLEQRLKDVETIARSLRRRWWLVGTGLVLGLIGWAFWAGAVRTRPGTMVLVAGSGLILNALLGIINERGWYRWWLIYALALLDVVLVAVLIVWFGHGGFVVAFLIAVLPYAFDQGHTVGNFLVLTAALAYLAAVQMHHALYGGDAALAPGPVLETVTLVVVAMTLKEIPATLIQRIRRTRSVMGEAEHGFLAVRAAAQESDELGFLEKSFNKMIEEIGGTISTVQREADEVSAFAEQLAASAEELHATSETVTHTAQRLAGDLSKQRDMAEDARGESDKAADQAEALRVRAELMQVDAARLVSAAERGRERVARASQTLRTVGEEVRATASTVAGLSGMSERIGVFAQTIARIGRP